MNVVTSEEKIVALLRQNGNMSANMLSVSVGITERQAQLILTKLKAEGEIIRHGANKNGYWEIIGIKIPNSVSEIKKVKQRLAF